MAEIGGYTNNGPLSAEHLRLPEPLRRRVGRSIKVLFVSRDRVTYRNANSGRTHTFVKIGDAWAWDAADG